MNRAERRQLQKKGLNGYAPATKTVGDFVHIYTLSIALALDSCEIPKDKCLEIIAKVEENADCMLHGYINQADIEQMCRDEYGIEFVEERKKHQVYVNSDGTLITS